MRQYVLPNFQSIFKFIFYIFSDIKPPNNLSNKYYDSYFFSKSRDSLKIIVDARRVIKNKKINILCPAYYCESALSELDRELINVIYYESNKNPNSRYNLDDYSNLKIDLIICVHYFGSINENLNEFSKLADKHGAWLIEDKVHLANYLNIDDSIGDFLLFSPYKHIALPSGAILYAKKSLISEQIKTQSGVITKLSWVVIAYWILIKISQKIFEFCNLNVNKSLFNEKKELSKVYGIDKFSLNIILQGGDQISRVNEFRLNNFRKLINLLPNSILDCQIFDASITSPYYLVLAFDNEDKCSIAKKCFMDSGWPLEMWPDMIAEIYKNEIFVEANKKYANLIYINISCKINYEKLKKDTIRLFSKLLILNSSSEEKWHSISGNIVYSDYLQSIDYVKSKNKEYNTKKVEYYYIEFNDKIISKFIVIKQKISFFKYYLINRGPLLLGNYSSIEIILILQAIKLGVIERFCALIINPGFSYDLVSEGAVKGFFLLNIPAYASSTIDLSLDEAGIMKGFKSKWRNTLLKGLSSKYKFDIYGGFEDYNTHEIIDFYEKHKKEIGYRGINSNVLREILKSKKDITPTIYIAHDPELPIKKISALVITIKYLDKSTYIVGASSKESLKYHLNSALLWQAIVYSKHDGSKIFDLGGLDETTPDGIKKFKSGLNGKPYRLSKTLFTFSLLGDNH